MIKEINEVRAIGDRLRERRMELNLSLKEAENATSIRSGYLQAIEDNDHSKLISPVYAQGFIRQYAAFLGLDGDRMLREQPDLFNRHRKEHEFSYGIGTLEVRGNPGAGVKWLPNAVWIGAFAVILIVAFIVARYLEVV